MSKYGLIYIIKNKINNKVYIGQTTLSINDRWKAHIKPSTSKRKSTYKLYAAFNKYGVNNFYIELLEDGIPVEQLNEKEIYYIELYDSFNNGYNSTRGGDGRIINNDYDIENIVNLFRAGYSPKEIGKLYNVSLTTICRLLRKEGYDSSKKFIDIDFVLNNYKNMTYDEIGKIFGVSGATIKRRLRENNIYKRRIYINNRDFDYESFIYDYENGMNVSELSEKYDFCKQSVSRLIEKIK